MEDLQGALHSILSDPEQLARVAALAESLGLKPPEDSDVGAAIGRPHEAEAYEPRDDLNLENVMSLLSASSGGEERVLAALRPALAPAGQSRVDRALRAAKLSRLAGALLRRRGSEHV